MKKYILCFLMLLFFPISTKALEKTEFVLEKGTIKDDIIELNLVMKNNPKFCYLNIEIIFDQENLEYISSNVIGLEKAMMKGIEKNLNGNLVVYALTLPESGLIDSSGKIASIKWKQKEDKEVNFKISVKEYAASDDQELPYEVTDFTLTKENKNSFQVQDKISLKDKLPEETQDETITWTSSDEKIAIVDQEGNVTFLKEGNVTIEGKKDDEVIYKKDYQIEENNKTNKSNNTVLLVSISIISIISIIILATIIIRKKNLNKKNI